MIIEWLMQVGAGFVEWLASLFPVLDLPDELVHLDTAFNDIFALGDGLGAFIPWTLVGALAALPLLVWAAGLTIRGLRALVAHLPYVGGRG